MKHLLSKKTYPRIDTRGAKPCIFDANDYLPSKYITYNPLKSPTISSNTNKNTNALFINEYSGLGRGISGVLSPSDEITVGADTEV